MSISDLAVTCENWCVLVSAACAGVYVPSGSALGRWLCGRPEEKVGRRDPACFMLCCCWSWYQSSALVLNALGASALSWLPNGVGSKDLNAEGSSGCVLCPLSLPGKAAMYCEIQTKSKPTSWGNIAEVFIICCLYFFFPQFKMCYAPWRRKNI